MSIGRPYRMDFDTIVLDILKTANDPLIQFELLKRINQRRATNDAGVNRLISENHTTLKNHLLHLHDERRIVYLDPFYLPTEELGDNRIVAADRAAEFVTQGISILQRRRKEVAREFGKRRIALDEDTVAKITDVRIKGEEKIELIEAIDRFYGDHDSIVAEDPCVAVDAWMRKRKEEKRQHQEEVDAGLAIPDLFMRKFKEQNEDVDTGDDEQEDPTQVGDLFMKKFKKRKARNQ